MPRSPAAAATAAITAFALMCGAQGAVKPK